MSALTEAYAVLVDHAAAIKTLEATRVLGERRLPSIVRQLRAALREYRSYLATATTQDDSQLMCSRMRTALAAIKEDPATSLSVQDVADLRAIVDLYCEV